MRKVRYLLVGCVVVLATAVAVPVAESCSRILWNDNGLAVVVARTMDWPESTEPILTVFPRGQKRDGGRLGSVDVAENNPMKWTSRYGSLATTIYGIGTADGVNERGLSAHMLYLQATNFGPRDASKPGLHAGLWAQYLLDNAATVTEALESLDALQVVMIEARGHKASVHLAIEDAGGDSAVIEFVDGKRVVHHGRDYKIMTNDPTYEEQLALLRKQDFSKPSSDTPLPGNVSAVDRFQRAAYFSAMLPRPKDDREAVAAVLAIARNVSVPFGAPYRKFGIYNTEYRTVIDLTNRRYFFELATSPNVIWMDLAKLNFAPDAPVMVLNPDDLGLSGEVSGRLTKAPKAPF
ncbi:MAG: linear amide C-N hydrolase [Paludisphaera borealis]|uniref:linear amide C-N hydrolase n=1 Tax=Paludisphaera borealis TaxID=1387353 RepID=UPI002846E6D8|nr:linear amide C-N hydrolase [Paludisphaera borealis]MDR3617867.1 linear amide C-N hydrolase [Paludisphaera borealis]